MRVQILITRWDRTEDLLKFGANNRLLKDVDGFSKGMDVKEVVNFITNSIINDAREFREYKVMGVMAWLRV